MEYHYIYFYFEYNEKMREEQEKLNFEEEKKIKKFEKKIVKKSWKKWKIKKKEKNNGISFFFQILCFTFALVCYFKARNSFNLFQTQLIRYSSLLF